MPSKKYKEYTEHWRKEMGDWYFAQDPNWRLRAAFWGGLVPVIREESENLSVCEIGGGCGYNLNAIGLYYKPKKIGRVLNIEPSPTMREFCQKTYSDMEVLDGEVADIPLKDQEVDLMVSCGLLLHIPKGDLSKALSEIFRCAKKHVVIIEYWSEEETGPKDGDGFGSYIVPHWSRDYEKPIADLQLPFSLRLTVPFTVKSKFEDGSERKHVQRGYFYERS